MSFIDSIIRGLTRFDRSNTIIVRGYPSRRLYLFHSSSSRPRNRSGSGSSHISVLVNRTGSGSDSSSSSSSSTSTQASEQPPPQMESQSPLLPQQQHPISTEAILAQLLYELEQLQRKVQEKKDEINNLCSQIPLNPPPPHHHTFSTSQGTQTNLASSTIPNQSTSIPPAAAGTVTPSTGSSSPSPPPTNILEREREREREPIIEIRRPTLRPASAPIRSNSTPSSNTSFHHVATRTRPIGQNIRTYSIHETSYIGDDGREILERRPGEPRPVRRVRFAL